MESFLDLSSNSINIIGIVKDYNENTREVAVYIPKFMPIIAEDKKETPEMTNYGNSTLNKSIQYSSKIKKVGYVWAMAKNINEKLPKKESRVLLTFMEGNPESLYWEPFNPNGDYDVIDNEKYDDLYTLSIGDKITKVMDSDSVKINLPDDFGCTLIHDKDKKQITFNILYPDNSSSLIDRLMKIIGNNTYGEYSAGTYKIIPSTGLIGRIEDLEKIIGSEENISKFVKVTFNNGDKIPDGIYVLEGENYTKVPVGETYDSTKTYYKAELSEASGILEALSLVDAALGYASSKDRASDKSITKRIEDIEDCIPEPPSTQGKYSLVCNILEDGSKSYSWEKQ